MGGQRRDQVARRLATLHVSCLAPAVADLGTACDDIAREVRDPLVDVIRVWAFVDRPGLQWRHLADELARQLPEEYRQEDAKSVSALLPNLGVPSVDVKHKGQVRKVAGGMPSSRRCGAGRSVAVCWCRLPG